MVVELGLVVVRRIALALRDALERVLRKVGQALRLVESVADVDAEPGRAAVEPEPEDVLEHRGDGGVAPVPVRLGDVEEVEVPLAVRDLCPAGAAEEGWPVVRLVAEDEQVALGAARPGGKGGLEQRMVARAVVGHDVDDDPQVQLGGGGYELVEVVQRAEAGVDVAVVGDVVPAVVHGGGVERAEPDRVDAQVGQVGESVDDSDEVAFAVAIRVREASRIDLIDDGALPPTHGAILSGVRKP